MSDSGSRWSAERDGGDADAYDRRWRDLEAAGVAIHGEADFVCRYEPASVLDAGCGTGRVAIELAARGIDVVGVDLDANMLAVAGANAPTLSWIHDDLATVELGRTFDVAIAPGNVMIFVAPGSERTVVANLARHLAPGGRLVAGFQLDQGYDVDQYDTDCAAAGLELVERHATWELGSWTPPGTYAVSVHSSMIARADQLGSDGHRSA